MSPPLDEPPERSGTVHRLGGKGIVYRSSRGGPDPSPADLARIAERTIAHTLKLPPEARTKRANVARLQGAYTRALRAFRAGTIDLDTLQAARLAYQSASGTLDRFKALR